MKKQILPDLFLSFLKIGLFTFGGGYAMIPLIEDLCVEKKGWITHDEMMDITVIAESTPGPIAINCATFVGCRQAGFRGALTATIGVSLPSFAIIFLISLCLDRFLELAVVANAFRGIKVAVGLLVWNAGVNMIKKIPKKAFSLCVMACSFAAVLLGDVFSQKVSSIALMLAAAAASLAAYGAKCFSARKDGEQK